MNDWITETLSRPPLRVDDSATSDSLKAELSERLEALLASYNGLEPTAEGWRALALALALKHEPAFKIETPVDRDSLDGRPVGFGDFTLRSVMKAEAAKLKSVLAKERNVDPAEIEVPQTQIAKKVAKRTGHSVGTINNRFSKEAVHADSMRRERYEMVAEKALLAAAISISQE